MSSAGQPSVPPRPSVFLSYSSEDRAAARTLRDALAAAGLEVWYDENELGGGDAWDQKIRRQIRDCDYFMPMISASTERRKEGYFRREWRLAAERTMDMADDVLFLLPVVIDGTSEASARVPEKFLTVQWIRAPDGEPTPALASLIQRLLAGEHHAAPRPPSGKRSAAASGPPPMPPFPQHPAGSGHWPKFFAEILWWILSAGWLLFNRMPRFLRIIVVIWAIITLLGTWRITDASRRPPRADAPTKSSSSDRNVKEAIKAVAAEAAAVIKKATQDGKGTPDLSELGAELARRFSKTAPDKSAAMVPVVLIPFARDPQNAAASQFASAAFAAAYAPLFLARPGHASVAPDHPGAITDEALAAAGRSAKADYVLGGRFANVDGRQAIAVRLVRAADGVLAWSADYPIAGADARAVGEKIAEAVLVTVPPKEK